MIGIYKITSPTNKIYIGQSVDIERRWNDHKNSLVLSEKNKLKSSFISHGFENHTFKVEEECSIELLNERERHYRDFYDVLGPNGLNLILTTTDVRSGHLSEGLKKRISETVKKTISDKTPEQKDLERSKKLGRVQSKETVEKRVKKTTGKNVLRNFLIV